MISIQDHAEIIFYEVHNKALTVLLPSFSYQKELVYTVL